jgi:citrate synthase
MRARRFLYQMDHQGQRDYVPNPVLSKALDVLFLLHADHELNASWSVARAHRAV